MKNLTPTDAARTASLALGRSPYSPGTSRLAADLERTETVSLPAWLDQYTGTVYRYAAKFRPPAPGFTCPKDGYLLALKTDDACKHPNYPHGVVNYSRPLTDDEIERFELVAL